VAAITAPAAAPVHVWEKQEITLTSARSFSNPYTEATVWVELTGPNFKKRVFGFWDGERTFRVRVVATEPGEWTWKSGSDPADEGLSGKSGSFTAVAWTEEEKRSNTLRRGFLRSTANHHGVEQADGTPFVILGDTWWATGTNCFRWYDDNQERPIGPTAGFKDYVRYRKAQGFNLVGIIAAFPNWATDGKPASIVLDDAERTVVRGAWVEFGTDKNAKNMDNEGGRPFLYPGKVPGYEDVFADVDRINPKYFDYLDRKIDYLNEQGFIPFIEVSRRDSSQSWKKFYKWPDSYSRFIEYIFARYHANNTILSPIHLDTTYAAIPTADFSDAIQMVLRKYGPPPFGNLLTANAAISTFLNWGEDSWVNLHQIGNAREHDYYWYLTQIFRSRHPQPALNGEPYYSGYKDARAGTGYAFGAPGGTEKDDQFVRSGIYGSFLSGGLAGHIYGSEAIWGADVQEAAPIKMWDAFQWNSAAQMKHLRTFAFSIGRRFQDLIPDADMITPSRTHSVQGYEGWAYAAHTPESDIVLAYFEKGCPMAKAPANDSFFRPRDGTRVRMLKPDTYYRAEWFDPRKGTWLDSGDGWLRSDISGTVAVPQPPSDADWGLRLVFAGAAPPSSRRMPGGAAY
jgi:hypothetical protein